MSDGRWEMDHGENDCESTSRGRGITRWTGGIGDEWRERHGEWSRDATMLGAVRRGRLRLTEVEGTVMGKRYQASGPGSETTRCVVGEGRCPSGFAFGNAPPVVNNLDVTAVHSFLYKVGTLRGSHRRYLRAHGISYNP